MSKAVRSGRIAIACLFLVSALINLTLLVIGQDFSTMADGAFIAFVRDAWHDVFVPNTELFISILIAFEASVGLLVRAGGRRAIVGLSAACAFHVGLMLLGWGFWLWSVPMLALLAWLLTSTVREARAAEELRPRLRRVA